MEASIECQLCAYESTEELDTCTSDKGWGEQLQLDEVESFLNPQLMDTSSLAYLLDSDTSEDYLELWFTGEVAKPYQGDRESQMADSVLPHFGEHLCVSVYLAPGMHTRQ